MSFGQLTLGEATDGLGPHDKSPSIPLFDKTVLLERLMCASNKTLYLESLSAVPQTLCLLRSLSTYEVILMDFARCVAKDGPTHQIIRAHLPPALTTL